MKPSERIKQLYQNSSKHSPETALQAVVDYLDEEYEKQCKHDFVYMTENDYSAVEKCRYCGEKRR